MKIDVDEHFTIRLKEVFDGFVMETQEGNKVTVCMRDDTIEINVMPGGENTHNWWRVNMEDGTIDQL